MHAGTRGKRKVHWSHAKKEQEREAGRAERAAVTTALEGRRRAARDTQTPAQSRVQRHRVCCRAGLGELVPSSWLSESH